jgi:catechol 2,3-dioxygenase-like lactoylglutathione lyase family enzyme
MADRTRFTEFTPIFPVSDIRAALDHYTSLGFRVAPYAGGDDYGFAERGKISLHFTYRPTSYYPQNGIAVAYLVVDDADRLFTEWTQPGIGGLTAPPADMEWGMHEGVHTDPDGNIIRFGSRKP